MTLDRTPDLFYNVTGPYGSRSFLLAPTWLHSSALLTATRVGDAAFAIERKSCGLSGLGEGGKGAGGGGSSRQRQDRCPGTRMCKRRAEGSLDPVGGSPKPGKC